MSLAGLLSSALLVFAFYLPGHVAGAMLIRKGDDAVTSVLTRLACAIGIAVPVLTLLAVTGLFRGYIVVASLLLVTLGLLAVGRNVMSGGERKFADTWSLCVGAVVIASFVLYSIPAEYVVNSRDPGVYTLLAENLARTGELIHRDPLVAAVSGFHEFAGGKKYPGVFITDGDRIVPQFFPGPFALLGFGSLVDGTWGALYVVPVVSALSVGIVACLGRELFGRVAGLCGAALVAVSYTQVWWGRHPSSEVMTQFLVLSGLWMSVRFHRDRRASEGIAAGVLLGAAMLMRVDAFLAALVLPAIFVLELFTGRRNVLGWLYPGVPLLLFALAALGYLLTFGGRYLSIIYEEHGLNTVLRVTPVAAVVVAAIAVLFVFARGRWGRGLGGFLELRGRYLAMFAAVGVVCLALWGYFVVPVPWDRLPAASREFDAYRSQILIRLVWFTTPAVAVIGAVGFLLAARRMSGGVAMVAGAFLSFGLLYTFVPNVAPDLPWATRRFVPTVFPLLCLFAGLAVAEAGEAVGNRLNRVAGVAASASLFAVALGWTVYLVLPILPFRELEGAVGQFDEVAAEIPASEVVFVEMPDGYDVSASTFDYLYGRNVLPYDRLRFIRESGRLETAGLLDDAVYVTTDGGPAPSVSDLEFREVGGGKVVAPRLRTVETRVPDEIDELDIEYRVFEVSESGGQSAGQTVR